MCLICPGVLPPQKLNMRLYFISEAIDLRGGMIFDGKGRDIYHDT